MQHLYMHVYSKLPFATQILGKGMSHTRDTDMYLANKWYIR